MPPHAVFGLALLAVLATTVLAIMFSRRAKPAEYGRDDGQPDVQPPSLTDLDGPFRRAAENVRKHPPVEAKYHPRPRLVSIAYPKITLTPRQIERVNTQRKLRGKQPLNRRGLASAIAHPSTRSDVRQPQTSNDWLAYLIAFEMFSADHQSPTISGCGGVTIDPTLPYNGHGGEFIGAGASGDWDNNYTTSTAKAIDLGVPLVTDDSPSSVSDSSSSYSSDSSSSSSDTSSSCDTGSSSFGD